MPKFDFSLSPVSVPGPRINRPQVAVGSGLIQLGNSLSQAATVLDKIGKQEDPITGMQLVSQYRNELEQSFQSIRQIEKNPFKQRKLFFQRQQEIEAQYGKRARDLNVKTFFAGRAVTHGQAVLNQALTNNNKDLNTYADTNILISERLTRQNLVNPFTDRIDTQKIDTSTGVILAPANSELISEHLHDHADLVEQNSIYLAEPITARLRLQKFSESILEEVLLSAARNHFEEFTLTDDPDFNIQIQVPVRNPATQKVVMMTLSPTSDQLEKAKAVAREEQAFVHKRSEEQRQAKLREDNDLDAGQTAQTMAILLHPDKTQEDRQRQIDAVVTGKFTYKRAANFVEMLGKLRALQATNEFAAEDVNSVVIPIQAQIMNNDRDANGRSKVTDQTMLILKQNATRDTYTRLYSRWIKNLDEQRNELQKYQDDQVQRVKRLFAVVPSYGVFDKEESIVLDSVLADFMNTLETVPLEQRTREFINGARETALKNAINFIASNVSLGAEAARALSPFKFIPTVEELPSRQAVSVPAQIDQIFRNKRDTRITTLAQRDEALFRWRLRKALFDEQEGTSFDPKKDSQFSTFVGPPPPNQQEWLDRDSLVEKSFQTLEERRKK